MNREFKFRVWDKTNKSFLCYSDDDDLFINIQGDIYLVRETLRDAYDLDYLSSSFYEISQFTGLKDCKGVEIYEGDIIEISYKNSSIKQNAKVVFEKGCFFADLGDRFAYHIYEVADNCEVIGNICENSELLK